MWNKGESEKTDPAGPQPPTRRVAPPPADQIARIGPSVSIKGKLAGNEDLLIEGKVDGEISVRKHNVTIGPNGRVKADIHSRSIYVDGEVEGNLFGLEEVVIRSSGKVEGNTVAPRVTLENGAKFRGSIDMQPQSTGEETPSGTAASERRLQRPAARPAKGKSRGGEPAAAAAGTGTGKGGGI